MIESPPLRRGDLVRCHLLGHHADDTPDQQMGYVREDCGNQRYRIYWFQQREEFVATIVQQSGELFATKAFNVFVRIDHMEQEPGHDQPA